MIPPQWLKMVVRPCSVVSWPPWVLAPEAKAP
jgi:hypothetical protein